MDLQRAVKIAVECMERERKEIVQMGRISMAEYARAEEKHVEELAAAVKVLKEKADLWARGLE